MRFQRHAAVKCRMAGWPAGCTLLSRKAGTQRRPEGGNDETHNELRDDRCGRPDLVNNYGAKRTYIVLPKSVGDAPKSWVAAGVPKLSFDCSSGTCILVKAWNGAGSAYEFYSPKTKSGEMMLTEIVMTPDRGN
jgi:hypothetical protein